MENQVYNWFVRKGNVIVQRNDDRISLQLDYGNNDHCLLTYTDANEIAGILTYISKQVWENPSYQKVPYTTRHYKTNGDEYYWEIENSKLLLKYNEAEEGIEIRYTGSNKLDFEINYVVEIIQIIDRLNQ